MLFGTVSVSIEKVDEGIINIIVITVHSVEIKQLSWGEIYLLFNAPHNLMNGTNFGKCHWRLFGAVDVKQN